MLGRKQWVILRSLLMGFLLTLGVGVQAVPNVGLPGAATPGGALPQIPEQVIAPAPRKPKKPLQEEEKPLPPDVSKFRFPVKQFKVEGVVEHPSDGITKETVTAAAEQVRAKFMKEKGGLTLVEVRMAARAITHLYRKAGYILTTVYIPPQDVTHERIVVLRVREGKLGAVRVIDNVMYSKSKILRIFKPYIGKAVQADTIEGGLIALNSYPGMDASGIFRPGKKAGETDLVIKVNDERRFSLAVGHDNTGTELTGSRHVLLNAGLNSPLGMGGRLSGSLVQNYDPKKGEFRALSYLVPVLTPNDLLIATYNHNEFTLGGSFIDSGIGGNSQTGKLHWEHYFWRDREKSLYMTVGLDREQAITFQNSVQLNIDNLTPLRLGLTYNAAYPRFRGYTKLALTYSHGFNNFLGAMGNDSVTSSRLGSTGQFASGKFNKVNFNGSYVKTMFTNQQLLFRLNAQYTQNLLTSLEQFSMGGINSVRAYPASEFLADEGYYSAVEWVVPAPFFSTSRVGKYTWGQVIQLTAFIDYAQGWLLQPLANSDFTRVTLSGYGVGLQLSWPNLLSGSIQVAKTFDGSVIPSDDKGTRFWFYIYLTLQ